MAKHLILANKTVIGIPKRLALVPASVYHLKPVMSIRFVDQTGEQTFYLEVAQNSTTHAFVTAQAANLSLLRDGVEWDEQELVFGDSIFSQLDASAKLAGQFSTDRLLNLLNATAWLCKSMDDNTSAKRRFSIACGYRASVWVRYLDYIRGALLDAVRISLREKQSLTDDRIFWIGATKEIALDGDPKSWPAWTLHSVRINNCPNTFGVCPDGVTVVKCDRPSMAMPFGDLQEFDTYEIVEDSSWEEPVPERAPAAFFCPEVAAAYSLVPDTPYDILEQDSSGEKSYLKVLNLNGEEIWIDRSKAIVVTK